METPKILVVDDQPINVQLLKRKLEREGMAVTAAYSGQEALDLLTANKPDLILLDVMMPNQGQHRGLPAPPGRQQHQVHPGHFHHRPHHKGRQDRGAGRRGGRLHHQPHRGLRRDFGPRPDPGCVSYSTANSSICSVELGDSRRAATIGAISQGHCPQSQQPARRRDRLRGPHQGLPRKTRAG